jgi:hypothetical protein
MTASQQKQKNAKNTKANQLQGTKSGTAQFPDLVTEVVNVKNVLQLTSNTAKKFCKTNGDWKFKAANLGTAPFPVTPNIFADASIVQRSANKR